MRFCLIFVGFLSIYSADNVDFKRYIEAVGFPYYKILFVLGNCKDSLLFYDQKIWGAVRLNRILDIYYKSEDPDIKVSTVEIKVVINNTDCFAFSETGTELQEFSATVYMPTNFGIVFYRLNIFACGQDRSEINDTKESAEKMNVSVE